MMKELETLKEGMAATTVVAAACAEGPGVVGPIFVDKCRNYLQVRVRLCCRVVLQTQTMHGSAHRGTLVLTQIASETPTNHFRLPIGAGGGLSRTPPAAEPSDCGSGSGGGRDGGGAAAGDGGLGRGRFVGQHLNGPHYQLPY